MSIRENKGITGVDISVAVIIILMFTSLLVSLIYNINIVSKNIERSAEATFLAQQVIEESKSIKYEDINREHWTSTIEEEKAKGYNLDITVELPESLKESVYNHYEKFCDNDIIKQVTAKVSYAVGKETKNIEISTIITR